MICPECKVVIPDALRFCPMCGRDVRAEVQAAAEAAEAQSQAGAPEPSEAAEEPAAAAQGAQAAASDGSAASEKSPAGEGLGKPAARLKAWFAGGKKKLLIIGGGVLAALLCAVLIPLLIHNAKQTKYNEGVTLLETGKYDEAEALFAELKEFDDSPDMVLYCRNMRDYQAAKRLMNSEQYEEAAEAFAALGAFQDAEEQGLACQDAFRYGEAEKLLEQGNYSAAGALFQSLNGYRDAAVKAEFCMGTAAYNEATAMMEAGDYAAAAERFESIPYFSDAGEKGIYCRNMDTYAEAASLFDAGEYYEAYGLFMGLEGFSDTADRMAECVQDFPSGETYHNEAFKSRSCSLAIKPPTSDGSRTYIKIYSESGELVSCLGIGEGKSGKVWLPAGSYQIKSAYGYGEWFGETDLFGDEGTYQVLEAGSTDVFELQKNYAYTLTLRSERDVSGDPVNTSNEDREDF